MFEKLLPLLLLVKGLVNGLKLSEEATEFNNDELNVIGNGLKGNHSVSLEFYRVLSNITEDSIARSIIFQNELNVWNPYAVAKFWNTDVRKTLNISENCEKEITDYLIALLAGEQWALKMLDATGRYTWGLLTGNVYWLGSVDQCKEMETKFIEWRNSKAIQRESNLPPFLVSMSSVTFNLHVSRDKLNETYRIIFGLCLPDTCGTKDTEKLLYLTQDLSRGNTSTHIVIENIRNLSKGYSFWEDYTFYVLLITFVVVILFVILGTFYDIYLRYHVLHAERTNRSMENMITEMKSLNTNQTTVDEITIGKLWSVKEHNGTLDICNTDRGPKPLSEALLSFSLLLNLSKLFSLDVGSDTLAPVHGLRCLSILWIILVHTCLTVNVISEGKTFKSNAENNFFYQTISNGTYAVDTFFFMSGCLVSFLYFRTITKDNLKKKKMIKGNFGRILQFLGMVWYRYFRLTPTYLVVIGLIQVSMSWYYSHSILDIYTLDYQNCKKFWWRNALYINTYFPMDERCVVWSWYLANDTLFYTIGTIILIIAARHLRIASVMTISILVISWITTAAIALNVDHVPSIQDPFAHYESLYDKPWSRIGPYLLGMITGWYLYKSNCRLTINKTIAFIFWVLSFITMMSIVYGLYGNIFGPFLSAVYTALSHSGWSISIAWILIACVTGHGGIINKVLSWKGLYPFSRLTYCVYLVHPAIIRAVVLRGEASMHLTQGFMAILFLGFTIASYAASLFLSLFFEAPMVSLLRIVHPLRQWKRTK